MAQPPARRTPVGRLLLVQRVLELRWSVVAAAEAVGVSRATPHRWLRRYREEGPAGLADRSSRPHRWPHAPDARTVRRILRARTRLRHGPHRLAARRGHPRSTSSAVLRRQGCPRLRTLDRSTGVPIRSVCERPGELVRLNVKQLARPSRRQTDGPAERCSCTFLEWAEARLERTNAERLAALPRWRTC